MQSSQSAKWCVLASLILIQAETSLGQENPNEPIGKAACDQRTNDVGDGAGDRYRPFREAHR